MVSTEPDAHGFVENDWIERTVAIGDEVEMTFRKRHHIQLVNRIRHWLSDAVTSNGGARLALA